MEGGRWIDGGRESEGGEQVLRAGHTLQRLKGFLDPWSGELKLVTCITSIIYMLPALYSQSHD